MKKLGLLLLRTAIMADSVDKVLSDEAHKVKRLEIIKEDTEKKITLTLNISDEINAEYQLALKALNTKLAEDEADIKDELDRLHTEVAKADKAIERLSK